MCGWIHYSQIKELINEYYELRKVENYDEFITKLTEILNV